MESPDTRLPADLESGRMGDKSAVGWIFGGIGIALLLLMVLGAVGMLVIFYVIGTGSH